MGFLGNVNDLRVLHWFGLYRKVQQNGLFEIEKASQNGFAPYILDDKGYPLISWIITPYKKEGEPFVLELLYNKKHKNGCSILKMFLAI